MCPVLGHKSLKSRIFYRNAFIMYSSSSNHKIMIISEFYAHNYHQNMHLYNKVEQQTDSRPKIKVLKRTKALPWMERQLFRITQRCGLSPACVCEGYSSQSFSIHQRAVANKSALVRDEQTASFVPSTNQSQAHKAFGCTTLQRRHTVQMTCFALWWFALCLCPPWPRQVYNITGSKSFQSLLLPVKDSRYIPSPIHPTMLSSLKQSRRDEAR